MTTIDVGLVPDDDTLERWLLGDVYRLAVHGRDRRVAGSHPVDSATGLPLSREHLLPGRQARRGDGLALSWPINPRWLAQVHMGLYHRQPDTWTEAESDVVEQATFKFKRVLESLARRGFVDLAPDLGLGEVGADPLDGRVLVAKITAEGLEHAKRVIPGTPLEHGPTSCVGELPPELRAGIPEWALDEYQRERAGKAT